MSLVGVSRIEEEGKGRKEIQRKDRFCVINYRDRLGRECESIRLRSTTFEREKRREEMDVSTLCATASWSSDKFVVSSCRGQYRLRLVFTKFGGLTRYYIVAGTMMHRADELTTDTR